MGFKVDLSMKNDFPLGVTYYCPALVHPGDRRAVVYSGPGHMLSRPPHYTDAAAPLCFRIARV